MTNDLKLPKIKNVLQLGMFLMIVKVSFSLSEILPYSDFADNILSFVSAGCFAIHILNKRYSVKTLVVYALIGTLALYSSIKVNNFEVLITVLTCLAIRNEDIDRLFMFLYKYEFLFFVFHTAYAVIRFFLLDESLVTVVSGVVRYHFGMGHPNRFSMYLFNLIILWIYLNFERLRNSHILNIALIGGISYIYTRTRTNLIEIIIVVAFLLMRRNVPFKESVEKITKKLSMYILPIFAGITMVCVYFYSRGNYIVEMMDLFLSSRIRLGAYAFGKYGLTIFGQPISYDVKYDVVWRLNTFTFDNTFTFLCISQGIIWMAIVIILFYRLSRVGDTKIHFAIIAWTLYGITEVHGLNAYMCFPILLVALLFDDQNYLYNESMDLGET